MLGHENQCEDTEEEAQVLGVANHRVDAAVHHNGGVHEVFPLGHSSFLPEFAARHEDEEDTERQQYPSRVDEAVERIVVVTDEDQDDGYAE